MIDVVGVAPANEMPVVNALVASVRATWPDLESHARDRVTIFVGLGLQIEIDALVFLELANPRALPAMMRRDGSRSSVESVQSAVLAIEIKQLDATRFTLLGGDAFPAYRSGRPRGVSAQAHDGARALVQRWSRYDLRVPFVHALGWLTEVDESELRDVHPWIVGHGATWPRVLDAAAQQRAVLYGATDADVRTSLATMRGILARPRVATPRDRAKANALSHDTLARDVVASLAPLVGTSLVRLVGHGGSGKTTTLALLAKHLATVGGERVLVLTFHKTLRADIAHLVKTTLDVPGIAGTRIVVETATAFFVSALEHLGVEPPRDAKHELDYARLDATLAETTQLLAASDITALRAREPNRFDFSYAFVDEAQDWTNAERDFLRAFFGHRHLVLADGLDQLVRRQTPCDWIAGVPASERTNRHLARSLRMSRNVATFANAVARELGLADWRIEPYDGLPGGRIVVALGPVADVPGVHAALRAMAAARGAAPVDTLTCVPPRSGDEPRYAAYAAYASTLERAGERVWNGTLPHVRDTVPDDVACWRVVQYDSCRGLEGWIALELALDRLVASKRKYPNLAPGETDAPEKVGNRWVMMALTRAVDVLIVTLDDPAAALHATFRAAATTMGDVVEWTTGAELAAYLRAGHTRP